MSGTQGPAVQRRKLGSELRKLRETSGLTIEEAGTSIDRSDSTISRIETGKRVPQGIELRGLLDAYNADPETRELLLRMIQKAPEQGWWTGYEDTLPPGLSSYIELEAEAAALRVFVLAAVHSLLRTEQYAQALLRAGLPSAPDDEITKLTTFHMKRQDVLTRAASPLEVVAVLDEASLRRQVGGLDVLRAQWEHLIHCAELPNVTLQILPFDKGAHGSPNGSFTLLDFPDAAEPPVAYIDSPGGNLYLQKPRDTRRFDRLHGSLRGFALDESESVRWLRNALKEM